MGTPTSSNRHPFVIAGRPYKALPSVSSPSHKRRPDDRSVGSREPELAPNLALNAVRSARTSERLRGEET